MNRIDGLFKITDSNLVNKIVERYMYLNMYSSEDILFFGLILVNMLYMVLLTTELKAKKTY